LKEDHHRHIWYSFLSYSVTSALKKRPVFWRNKNYTLLINWINTWKEEILTNLEILSFCIHIATFARNTFLMMTNLDAISMSNISHVMSVVHNISIVITSRIIISRHITKCLITYAWKKIVLIKNSLPLKLLMNSKYIECKCMKNKIKKLISSNYADFNIKDKVLMTKLSLLRTNKVSIWNANIFHWKKVKTELLGKPISKKINILISETFIIANSIKMSTQKKLSPKKLLINKPKSKKESQSKKIKMFKIKRKNIFQNNK